MDRNKPITFKDLKFEPHPVSMFFGGHAKIFIDKVGTVSIVGHIKTLTTSIQWMIKLVLMKYGP